MAFINTIPVEGASEAVAELYEADEQGLGYVANYTQTFSHRPQVYQAWAQLNQAIKTSMDLKHYELATFAAATSLKSSYCTLAHGKVLATKFYDPQRVTSLAQDYLESELSPAEKALMTFAKKVAGDAEHISQDDVDGLKEVGFSDADVFNIALTAAARCFFSKVLDATGTRPDAAFRALEPSLREALTVALSH